ncbi:MAG: NAD(P)-dependent alcohol dehydrogenase [Myxococcales bacterium]|nr:NAD(P)-dependent alcohol dehydrogenase [Myxococcales bacterium]USN50718.1 MAG: NAD(P)-dependent alcohol dehydrogenase [Myxococcales bacterium]
MNTKAYATNGAHLPLESFTIERREVGQKDVAIDILYCGVCHSDLHTARNEWGNTKYPCVPGHEIVGRVSAVGNETKKYKVGDIVGVGCLVDSCRVCPSCTNNLEQYCQGAGGATGTYNGLLHGEGPNTYGGYSRSIVVDEDFVLKISHHEKELAAVAPLLCAGITTYSALRHWHTGPGKKVGIAGIGGLGHVGVKLARAMGAHVVAFTTSTSKIDTAINLGAHEVVISKDEKQMAHHASSFDFILNTVAASHNLDVYVQLLKRDSTLTLVGAPAQPHPSPTAFNLIFARRSIAGSVIGEIAETQEMLDFCAAHGITADIEMISMNSINQAYERMLKGDVKYRFVIDMASL